MPRLRTPAVALALVVAVVGLCSAFDDTCPASMTKCGSADEKLMACDYENTFCRNGGYFPGSSCCALVPGALSPFEPNRTDYKNWNQTHVCECAPGFLGVDCALRAPDGCAAPLVYEGRFYTPPTAFVPSLQEIECFLVPDAATMSLSLHQQRVNVSITRTSPKDASQVNVDLTLSSRHKNVTSHDLDCHGYVLGRRADLECAFRECVATSQAPKGALASGGSAAPNVTVITCPKATCTSCGDTDPNCSAILAVIAKTTEQVTLTVSNMTSSNGTGIVTMDTSDLVLPFKCAVGTCEHPRTRSF